MSYKEKFIEIYNAKIKRQGAKELLAWLEKTDFFTAPASTKYHGSIEEGLVMHSLNVYEMFHEEVLNRAKRYSGVDTLDDAEEEKVAICALLHDLCKVNFRRHTAIKRTMTVIGIKLPIIPLTISFATDTAKNLYGLFSVL
jgi:hypothetical protein